MTGDLPLALDCLRSDFVLFKQSPTSYPTSSSFAMRTIIDFEDSQACRLDAWAKAEKISRAEAVRRAVNQMLERAGQMRMASRNFAALSGLLCQRCRPHSLQGPRRQPRLFNHRGPLEEGDWGAPTMKLAERQQTRLAVMDLVLPV